MTAFPGADGPSPPRTPHGTGRGPQPAGSPRPPGEPLVLRAMLGIVICAGQIASHPQTDGNISVFQN